MKKCFLLFILLVAAIFLFKVSTSDGNNTSNKADAKELASISENEEIAKN